MPAVSFAEFELTLNRARGASSSTQQDAAFDALKEFTSSGKRPQQLKAAKNLPEFYSICRGHQTEIHYAIMDLCEDVQEEVRIAGYNALMELSEREPSVRRKNTDVFCQLLQNEDDRELRLVRTILCKHMRLDPKVAYPVIVESMVSKSESGKITRCYLMDKMVAFLCDGGYKQDVQNTGDASNVEAFRQLDGSGGKGAILEVSWIQQNVDADNILCSGISQALRFSSIDEARRLISGILFNVKGVCRPLADQMIHTVNVLKEKTRLAIQEDKAHDFDDLTNTLAWLELCNLVITPPTTPIPFSTSTSSLPRASPVNLLRDWNGWILDERVWRRFPNNARRHLLALLGALLKSCRDILDSKLDSKHAKSVAEGLKDARRETAMLAEPIFESWLRSSAFGGDEKACSGITELVLTVNEQFPLNEREKNSEWAKKWSESTRLQNIQRLAMDHFRRMESPQFEQLIQAVQQLFAAPTASHAPAIPSDHALKEQPTFIRKRSRDDANDSHADARSPTSEEDRLAKRKKTDLLSRINRIRVSSSSPDVQSPVPDSEMPSGSINGPRNPLSRGSSFPSTIPSQSKPVILSGLSIRGAAKKSITEEKSSQRDGLPRTVSGGRPASTPIPREGSNAESRKGSTDELLFGKRPVQEFSAQMLSQQNASTFTAPSLLARLGESSAPQEDRSRSSIFERLGVSQGDVGQGKDHGRRRYRDR